MNMFETLLSNGQLVLYICICLKTGSCMKAFYCTFFVRILLSTIHWIGLFTVNSNSCAKEIPSDLQQRLPCQWW